MATSSSRVRQDVVELADYEHDMDDDSRNVQLVIRFLDKSKHERLHLCAKWAICVKKLFLCQPHN